MKKTLLFALLLLVSSLGFAQGWMSYSSSIFGRDTISECSTQKVLLWDEKYLISLSKPNTANGGYFLELTDYTLNSIKTIYIPMDSVFDIAIVDGILFFSCEDISSSVQPKGYIGKLYLHNFLNNMGNYSLIDIGQHKMHVIKAYKYDYIHVVGVERNAVTGGNFYDFVETSSNMNIYHNPSLSMQDVNLTNDYVVISAKSLGGNPSTIFVGRKNKYFNTAINSFEFNFSQNINVFTDDDPILIRCTNYESNQVVTIGDGMQGLTPITQLSCFDVENLSNISNINNQNIYQERKPAITYDAIYNNKVKMLFIVQRNHFKLLNKSVSFVHATNPYDASFFNFTTNSWFDFNADLFLNSIELFEDKFIVYGYDEITRNSRFLTKDYSSSDNCAILFHLPTKDINTINPTTSPNTNPFPSLLGTTTTGNNFSIAPVSIDCQ